MYFILKIIKIFFLTFTSKILGFIRDITIAAIFGMNHETDAFFISFKLSNILRKFFAEGAFSYVFIPMLSKYKNNKNKINEFISSIYIILLICMVIISSTGIIFTKQIICITSPGFLKQPEKLLLTIKILKITFSYICLICLTSFISSILNTWNKFTPSFTHPIILNITIILFTLYNYKNTHPNIFMLPWAVIIGGILQLIFQKTYLNKIPVKLHFSQINIKNKKIYKTIKNMFLAMLNISVNQINQIINIAISSYFIKGSISWIYYADKLTELPVNILGTTISTIILPNLSQKYHQKDKKGFSILINKIIKIILIISIPISLGIIILSKNITFILLKHGNFCIFDIIMITKILINYTLGLTGFILLKIFTACYYSQFNNKTPTNISIINLIINQIINFFTLKIFKHTGLALSTTITTYITVYFMYKNLKNKHTYKPTKFKKFISKILFANTFMLLTFYKLTQYVNLTNNSYYVFIFFKVIIVFILGLISYIFSLIIINLVIK